MLSVGLYCWRHKTLGCRTCIIQVESDLKASFLQSSVYGSRRNCVNSRRRETTIPAYPAATPMNHKNWKHDKTCVEVQYVALVCLCQTTTVWLNLGTTQREGNYARSWKHSQSPGTSVFMGFRKESTANILLDDQSSSLHYKSCV